MAQTTQVRIGRLDGAESIYFSRQLENIRAKTYDVKYPQLKGRTFVPVDHSVDPGAETVTYRQYDMFGIAKIAASYADDIKRVDVKGKEFSQKIKPILASFGYNVQEVRAARFTGQPMEQRKANASKRAIEEGLDKVAQTGDSATGLLGLLNQSNTTVFTVPNGSAGTATWATKTPDEIAADLNGIANNIVSTTKEVEAPDTILLPLTQYTLIATTRMGDGSDVTILEFFKKNSPYIKDVQPWYALTGAGAAGKDRMVCYRNDPDALQLVIPQEYEMFPIEVRGLEFITICHMRTAGVIVYYPLSISYGDGI